MKISIITINLNNATGLLRTINSVISQTTKNFEFLVVDGDSTDNSLSVIEENKKYIHNYIIEKDKGIYDAMNKGINTASGDYFMFLNSGDIFESNNIIERCFIGLKNHSDVDVFYGDMTHLEAGKKHYWRHPKTLDISFFKKNNINHQSALISTKVFKDIGLYPAEYKYAGDHWLFLTAMAADKKFLYLDELMVEYESNGISVSKRVEYEEEMDIMWKKVVPSYVSQLVDNFLEVKYAQRFPFLKAILPIDYFITYKKKKIAFILFIIIILLVIIKYSL